MTNEIPTRPIEIESAAVPTSLKWFDVVGMAFVAILLVSNITAQKLIAVGPFTFTAGIIFFPISYIFGDVLTEVYGYARSRRIIWTGLAANIFMAAALAIAVALTPAPGWPLQKEFVATLGQVPRVVLGSIVGYFVGEFVNSFVLAKLKVFTAGRMLWVRTIGSTVVGEGVDTLLFLTVAFAGRLPPGLLVQAGLSGWVFKVLYETLATPLTYAAVRFLKAREGFDVYDRSTNFSPFRFRV